MALSSERKLSKPGAKARLALGECDLTGVENAPIVTSLSRGGEREQRTR
jgi:hypothetical protein